MSASSVNAGEPYLPRLRANVPRYRSRHALPEALFSGACIVHDDGDRTDTVWIRGTYFGFRTVFIDERARHRIGTEVLTALCRRRGRSPATQHSEPRELIERLVRVIDWSIGLFSGVTMLWTWHL